MLGRASSGTSIVEVRYRHPIRGEDRFRMEPGFANFQRVKKGELLARDHKGQITARESGMVLLPLYQALGDDGFFLGREVRPFWLKLSAILRKLRVGDYSHCLPGVRRDPGNDLECWSIHKLPASCLCRSFTCSVSASGAGAERIS